MNIEKIALEVANELGWSLESSEKFIACCLKNLAEQDVEPVAWQDTQTGMIYTTVSPAAKHLYSPLYTEAQLLGAQQRTAEACAKAVFEQAKYFGYNVHAEAVRDAALSK